MTHFREEKCALNFEPIGREPLEADRRIGAVGTGSKVLPDTRLRVEIRSDRPAVERLHFGALDAFRSEEHTSELQSLMRISYAVFCLKKKKKDMNIQHTNHM